MKQTWGDYDRAAEHGPLAVAVKVIGGGLVVVLLLSGLGYGLGLFGEAATVAREEFGPRALLVKYEWFKEAAAQLDKKRADITVYEARMHSLSEAYADRPRATWPRDDREQLNQWTAEVAGVTASFNALAADYNAQMAKFHWRFANAGQLPAGATEPLPREFAPYAVR